MATGVNGMTMVIGRDESSSAAASSPAIPFTAKAAARITATLGIELSQHEGAGNDADGTRKLARRNEVVCPCAGPVPGKSRSHARVILARASCPR
jgi:hypothetical protein